MNPLVVITGGTKGIGKALIEEFLAGGFDIITCQVTKTSVYITK